MAFTQIKGTATISTTEWSLTNGVNGSSSLTANTGPVKVSIEVDANAVAAGDTFVMAMYAKANGGTQRLIDKWYIAGAQGKLWFVPEQSLGEGWEITLLKTGGTDRSLLWTISYDDAASSLSSSTIENAVLNATASSHTTAGSIGKLINNIDVASSTLATSSALSTVSTNVSALPSAASNASTLLGTAVPGAFSAGTAGKLLGNLDAAVSTRAQPSDVPSSATNASALLGTSVPGAFGAGTAGKALGQLDAAISTRAQPSDVPSAGTIAAAVAAPSAATIAAAILAATVDSSAPVNAQSLAQILNVIIATVIADATGLAADGSIVIKNTGNTKTRVSGTFVAGTRTLVTVDGT